MTGGETACPIGYVPYGVLLDRPADRRRFPRYAAMRGQPFDVVSDWEDHEVVVLSSAADITRWVAAPEDHRVVFDFPDAYLAERHGFRRSARGLAKWVVGEFRHPVLNYRHALERMLERADAVVCSTQEQAAAIACYNDNVHPILDLHGEFEFRQPSRKESGRLDIVWEGLTATLPAVRQVLPALRSLAQRHDLRLNLVTDLEAPRYMNRFGVRRTEKMVAGWDVEIELHRWSLEVLSEVVRSCDVAIVPVDLADPLAAGKPENRIRIFWRLGLPVVASASPAHVRAASAAGLGDRMLCSTEEEWEVALHELWSVPDSWSEMASAGQAAAQSTYSEESLARRWDQVFDSLTPGRP